MTELALLEQFCPPEGYVTSAAFATTFSADLVVCLALLSAMDGVAGGSLQCTRIDALRALERFKDKVRIISNANRIDATGGDSRVMALFDRIVRTAPFDSRTQAFHPKVILARQTCADLADKYILHVGSRNLTASASWDFGITLAGEARGGDRVATRTLPDLQHFVRGVLDVVNDAKFFDLLGRLEDISWKFPSDIDGVDFKFHGGDKRSFDATLLASFLPPRGDVLLVSPFLNAAVLTQATNKFKKADSVRLVAGPMDLEQMCATNARKVFVSEGGFVQPLQIDVAPTDPLPTCAEDDEATEELVGEGRGLHAKVFVQRHNERFRMILGSANLTDHAWTGPNWEAVVALAGHAKVVEPLYEWARTHAHIYRPPAKEEIAPEPNDVLDAIRADLSNQIVHLDEPEGLPPTAVCPALPQLLARHSGIDLTVERFSTPGRSVQWRNEVTELPPCKLHERTALLRVRVRHEGRHASWLQYAEPNPPIGLERDHKALVEVLGVEYLGFIETLLTGDEANSGEPSTDTRGQPGNGNSRLSLFRLEKLLLALVTQASRFDEVQQMVNKHRAFLANVELPPDQEQKVKTFLCTWDAIVEGMALR